MSGSHDEKQAMYSHFLTIQIQVNIIDLAFRKEIIIAKLKPNTYLTNKYLDIELQLYNDE